MPSLQLHEPQLSFECTSKNKDFCFPDSASYLKKKQEKRLFFCSWALVPLGLWVYTLVYRFDFCWSCWWRLEAQNQKTDPSVQCQWSLEPESREINWCDLVVVYPAWKVGTVFEWNVALHRWRVWLAWYAEMVTVHHQLRHWSLRARWGSISAWPWLLGSYHSSGICLPAQSDGVIWTNFVILTLSSFIVIAVEVMLGCSQEMWMFPAVFLVLF